MEEDGRGEHLLMRMFASLHTDYRGVTQDYRKGELLTGELKAKCIKILQEFVKNYQDVRLSLALNAPPYHSLTIRRAGEGQGHRGAGQDIYGWQSSDRTYVRQEQGGGSSTSS